MVNLMRKYQQSLMLLVTLTVVVSFVWYGQRSTRAGADRVGTIYGRNVTMAQYGREGRKFEFCRPLGLFDFWMSLIGADARTENQAVENFVWNSLVLRHEADALGIDATEDEILDTIQKLPNFQTNGAYDSSKYNNFVQVLGSRGMTADQIIELVRDHLRLTKIKNLIGATVSATPAEVRSLFEQRNQKSEVSFIRFKQADFSAEVSDEDVKKAFEERKDGLKSEQLRKVKMVSFNLEKSDKPMVGKERVAELSKLGEQAQEFALAMTAKDANFDEVAKKFGVKVQEPAAFAASAPPQELGQTQEAIPVIFQKLSPEQPNSDVVMSGNGYLVFQLASVTEAKPLSFEEAKPKLITQLKEERTQEALNLKSAEVRTKLTEAMKAGQSFADAATAAGVKAESLPAFSPIEPPKNDLPDAQMIAGRSMDLAVGELSETLPTANGTLLVYVNKRLPIDEQKLEQEKATLTESVTRGKEASAFELWLKERRTVANLDTSRG